MSSSSPSTAALSQLTSSSLVSTNANPSHHHHNMTSNGGGGSGLVSPGGSKATACSTALPCIPVTSSAAAAAHAAALSPLFGPMSPMMNYLAAAAAVAASNGGNRLSSPPSMSPPTTNGTGGHKSPPNQLSPNHHQNNGSSRPVHSSLQEIYKAQDDRENPQVLKMTYQKLAQEFAKQDKELKNALKQIEVLKKEKEDALKSTKEELDKTKKDLLKAQSRINAFEDSLKKRDVEHGKQMEDIKSQATKERAQLSRIHTEEIKALKRSHQRALDSLQSDLEKSTEELKINHKKQIQQLEESIKKKDTLIQGYERSMVEQIAASQNAPEYDQRPAPASKKSPKKSKNHMTDSRSKHSPQQFSSVSNATTSENPNGVDQEHSQYSSSPNTACAMEVNVPSNETECNGFNDKAPGINQNLTDYIEIAAGENGNESVNVSVKQDPEDEEETEDGQQEPAEENHNTSSETLPSLDSSLMSPEGSEGPSGLAATKRTPSKLYKKKEGKFGSGEPGWIYCEICGRLQWYSHMQRRYGCFSCEPCYKFYKRYLADPKQYKCEFDSNCSLKISGDRNLASARCKFCWLVACKSNFTDGPTRKPRVLDPNARLEKKLKSPNNVEEKKEKKGKKEKTPGEGEEGKKRGRPVKTSENGPSSSKVAKVQKGKKKVDADNQAEGDQSQDGFDSAKKGKGKRGRPTKKQLVQHSHDPSPSSSTSTSTSTYPTNTSDESMAYDHSTSRSSGAIPFQHLTLHLPPPPGPTQLIQPSGEILMEDNPLSDPNAQYHLLTSNPTQQMEELNGQEVEDMSADGLKACGLCGEFESVERGPLITCSTCPLAGHAGCLDCPADLFEKILGMASWRCPQCLPHP